MEEQKHRFMRRFGNIGCLAGVVAGVLAAVNLGAGSPLLAHKQDEQLPETDLLLMADLLEDWLR